MFLSWTLINHLLESWVQLVSVSRNFARYDYVSYRPSLIKQTACTYVERLYQQEVYSGLSRLISSDWIKQLWSYENPDILFKWGYVSQVSTKLWLSYRQKCRGRSVESGVTSLKMWWNIYCWRVVQRSASASLPLTWLFLRVGKAIIPHLKEKSLSKLLIKYSFF